MFTTFVRLRVQLTLGSFRRGRWRSVGMLVAAVLGIIVIIWTMATQITLRSLDAEFARMVSILLGALILVGLATVPMARGGADPMDPRAFAGLELSSRRLANLLLAAAGASVPIGAVILVAFAGVIGWTRGFWLTVLAVICGILAVATATIVLRLMTSVAAVWIRTERAQDAAGTIGIFLLVTLPPLGAIAVAYRWVTDRGLALRLTEVVSWTPFGAIWAVPGEAATGNGAAAVIKLLLAAVYLAGLWLLWQWGVARMLVLEPGRPRPVHVSLGWFELLSFGPSGAIAARSITYWMADSRYRVSLLMVPVVPILMMLPLIVVGVPGNWLALIPVPVMCLFLGWLPHNDVSYDGTAVWLNVASGIHGFTDRLGRLAPALIIGLPVLFFGSIISAGVFGNPVVFSSLIGVGASLLLVGLGLSSLTSALLPYPATRPSDGAFAGPQTASSRGAFVQTGLFLLTMLLSLPTIVFAGFGFWVDSAWHLTALVTGLGTGVGVLLVGVFAGGWAFSRRGPRLLEASLRT